MKLYLVIVVFFLFLVNCEHKQDVNNTTWLILIDMSGMKDTHSVRKIYADNLSKVLNAIKGGDRIIAALITESSVNEPTLLINYKIPLFIPSTNNELFLEAEKKKFNKKQKHIRDSLYKKLDNYLLISTRVANHTDIIGGLHIAESIFQKFNNTYKKLIIFSDMEENSDKYKFPFEKITVKKINSIIEKERNSIQGLPELNNVNVYITGAHSQTNEKFFAVRQFWLKFFETCGAKCTKSNYSSSSISIE